MHSSKNLFFIAVLASSSLFGSVDYTADFSKAAIGKSDNVSDVKVGPATYYNLYYGNSWLLHSVKSSFVEIDFDKPADVKGKATLNLTHLASLVNGKPYSPVNISINDNRFLDHYDPASGDWVYDSFDISDYLVDGTNKVKISLCMDAVGNYWINKINVHIDQ